MVHGAVCGSKKRPQNMLSFKMQDYDGNLKLNSSNSKRNINIYEKLIKISF